MRRLPSSFFMLKLDTHATVDYVCGCLTSGCEMRESSLGSRIFLFQGRDRRWNTKRQEQLRAYQAVLSGHFPGYKRL